MNSLDFLVVAALAVGLSAAEHEISGRILNGERAESGQFKYMVWLRTFDGYPPDARGSSCGGILIASTWVLTAAHCLTEKDLARVYLGAVDKSRAAISYTVMEPNFRIHPEWSQFYSRNDIALIRIRKTLECNNIGYARLPYPWTQSRDLNGKIALVMGWGRMGDEGPRPKLLQWAEMEIIGMEDCRRHFGSKANADVHICASSKKPHGTVCSGDSGGPLVLKETGELIGITSTKKNPELCTAEFPALFTRVGSFLPWITAETGIFF